ncbi:plastocyanin [Polaromonas sp.]|jgi:plastocyanin|uniref:cupredoxin domain-containing protein n=1 Tax=Polaromonas sp. TaxID=1869339 RepID=UPI001D5CAF3C|nr:plastocyanin [Polaromonas sp.]MBT9477445.1 plastocyanin [Polaromonas sp.]
MKKTLLTLLLCTLASWASAGNLTVSVIDKEGKPVADAVVVVIPANKTVLPKIALPPEASITQEKMQFLPAVTLVPVGAKVRFINNDAWDHHVRSSPAGMGQFNASNAGFELRLEGKSEGKPAKPTDIRLDKAGVMGATLMGCFIHGSMRGYVYASESPWASKTSAEGLAIFEDLPDGAAQIRVWQADQLLDLAPQQATVGATLSKSVVQLSVVPRRRRL